MPGSCVVSELMPAFGIHDRDIYRLLFVQDVYSVPRYPLYLRSVAFLGCVGCNNYCPLCPPLLCAGIVRPLLLCPCIVPAVCPVLLRSLQRR